MISILIPAYHAGGFLPAALAGVASQTYPDWELIVVEDGSHDVTKELVTAFAAEHDRHRVVYENLETNRGVSAARNRLLDLAQGPIVAFLDADDVWRENHLATLLGVLNTGADLAVAGIEIWDASAHRLISEYHPPHAAVANPLVGLFERSFIQTSSSVALRRELASRVGRFDESLQIGEDRDFWFRCLLAGGRLSCAEHITCRYTKHTTSAMTRTLRVAEDAVRFYRKHGSEPAIPSGVRRARLAEALEILGRLNRKGQPAESRLALKEALRLEPWRWRAAAALLPSLVSPFRRNSSKRERAPIP